MNHPKLLNLTATFAACCLATLAPALRADSGAPASVSGKIAGSIEATLDGVDGGKVVLSAISSHYEITVDGDLANVRLTQRFENPYDKALNARYLFPLNRQAAVHAMTMRVGDEVIRAQIQEINQAKQTFTTAQNAGKAAALLEQHRPNMFTQRIANLMPGMPIEVAIEYAQTVPQIDGAYELVVPTVVGPRFQPAGAAPDDGATVSVDPTAAGRSFGQWQLETLPAYSPTAGVDLPSSVVGERISMILSLETPMALLQVHSDTHALTTEVVSPSKHILSFAKGRVLDNRDFVLRYRTAGGYVNAGLLSHWEVGEGGYFSLLIEPPADVSDQAALPREMVFLLDCSGSMHGMPMNASKAFMERALQELRPTDTFRIIRFSDAATEFSSQPLPATPANVQRGLAYTRNLNGSGGTMMSSGIKQALMVPVPAGAVRNVVFLTDGYIGNEIEVLKLVTGLIGDGRLYAFGVGAGVNRYLLSELGRTGRGFARYFDPSADDETVDAVVSELARKLQSPVLTDLKLDWGELQVSEVVPARLPDLYQGNSLRVTGRFADPAQGHVTISGRTRQHRAAITNAVGLGGDSQRPSIRRIWARTAIAENMHALITPPALRPAGASDATLKRNVTNLGLTYGLATRWTAFVAVSERRYNANPGANAEQTQSERRSSKSRRREPAGLRKTRHDRIWRARAWHVVGSGHRIANCRHSVPPHAATLNRTPLTQ